MSDDPRYSKSFFVNVKLSRFQKERRMDAEMIFKALKAEGIEVQGVTLVKEIRIYKGVWNAQKIEDDPKK